MKYMLLIYETERNWQAMPTAESKAIHDEYMTLARDLKTAGKFLGGDALQSVHTATTVRIRDGKLTTTDGPFAETRDQLGGFYLVEAKDLDEATQFAQRIPAARNGAVEIRPVMETTDGKQPG